MVSSCFFPIGDRLDPTAVNILQQIIELGSETHDATAVASVVAMAPGTVTVVKQVRSFCSQVFVFSGYCPSSHFCFQDFSLPRVEFEMKLVRERILNIDYRNLHAVCSFVNHWVFIGHLTLSITVVVLESVPAIKVATICGKELNQE